MKSYSVLAGLGAVVIGAMVLAVCAAEEEGKEEKVSIDKVPAAVKTTIEAEGGKVEDIDKQTEDGKTIYEADVIKDGKEIELRIGEDGKLISRQVEGDAKEGEDDGDEEDEGEDDEKEAKPDAQSSAKVSLLEAIEAATKAVPNSRVVRLEHDGVAYAVIVATQDKLQSVEIDAQTGKLGKVTEAKMDKDEFQDAAAANKAIDSARLTLAKAVALAEKSGKGKASEAELKLVDGKPRFEVKVGAQELAVDAVKGEVIKPPNAVVVGRGFRDSFPVDKKNLVSAGRNPYFILEPGFRCSYAGGSETLVITVLNDTKVVDGVETRVVEEREMKNGKLAEVSRNYFAIDKTSNDVYYFGEEVDIYKNDKIVKHEGAWLSGEKGAKFGLVMPGKPKVGDKFYQEMAPKQALDRAEIVSLDEKMKTPAGDFEKCLYVKETSPLELGSSKKWYVAGIGLVRDDGVLLVKVEDPKKPEALKK